MRSTTPQLQVEREERHRAIQVLCAHHTPATGGEERESKSQSSRGSALTTHQLQVERRRESIETNQVYGRLATPPATGGEERES